MTAKEKAKELIEKHTKVNNYLPQAARQSALITVDEIINAAPLEPSDSEITITTEKYWYLKRSGQALEYWEEVKQEIQKL